MMPPEAALILPTDPSFKIHIRSIRTAINEAVQDLDELVIQQKITETHAIQLHDLLVDIRNQIQLIRSE